MTSLELVEPRREGGGGRQGRLWGLKDLKKGSLVK